MSALVAAFMALASQTASEFSAAPGDHHAAAPNATAEVVVVVIGVIITVLVAVYTVKYFVKPGEAGKDHIKRRILSQEAEPNGHEGHA